MARFNRSVPSWLRIAGLPALLLVASAVPVSTASADTGIRLRHRKPKVGKKKPRLRLKKRTKKKLRLKPSGDGGVSGGVATYKQSRVLLTSQKPAVVAARNSVKGSGETNRSLGAIAGVPLPSNLSDLRRAIVSRASAELGKVDPNPANPAKIGNIRVKQGVERLAEYNAVAYGTNAGLWLNASTLTKLVSAGKKHTTWCGIFALWAVKMGAGVTASNFRSEWQTVLGPIASPILAFLSTQFVPEPDGFLRYKSTYKNLQWGTGGIFVHPVADTTPGTDQGDVRDQLFPTPIDNWLKRKGSVPPIKAGDVGYTREPVFQYKRVNGKLKAFRTGAVTYHHYIIDRVMKVDGKHVYFTIEGNYFSQSTRKNQSIVRNYRVYDPGYKHTTASSGRHQIEGWYDVDIMPRVKHNPLTKASEQQP